MVLYYEVIVHHTVDDPLDPDRSCVGGFVEHTFKRLVVSHDLKGSSIQEQVKFLAPKITCIIIETLSSAIVVHAPT